MRTRRALAGFTVGVVLAAAGSAPAEEAAPAWGVVQALDPGQVRGLPRPLFLAGSAVLSGDYLYVSGDDGLLYFKRDPQTGKLESALAGVLGRQKQGSYILCLAGGRLYSVRGDGKGIAWYDLDPATGRPTAKGTVETPPCRQMVAGPEGKDLYLKTVGEEPKVLWYRLEADGKPVKAGEAAGKGIGPTTCDQYEGILRMSDDGKHLYAVSAQDHAIALIERKAGGEIAYKEALDLTPMAARDPGGHCYCWASLALSPEGRWVYASLWSGRADQNVYGIFRRDQGTGALKFSEVFSARTDPLANQRAWALAFGAEGTGGCLGSWIGPVLSFRYDAETGRLTDAEPLVETAFHGTARVVCDRQRALFYICGNNEYGSSQDAVFTIGLGAPAAPRQPCHYASPVFGADAFPAANEPALGSDKLPLIQIIKATDLYFRPTSPWGLKRPGSAMLVFDSMRFVRHGQFLYANARETIVCFRPDKDTGRLAYLGYVNVGDRLAGVFGHPCQADFCLASAGKRLYAFSTAGGVAWYEVAPSTGEPVEKGFVPGPRVQADFKHWVLAAPGERDFYLLGAPRWNRDKDGSRLLWYHLDNDGKPQKASEMPLEAGYWGLSMSPDGRSIYAVASNGPSLACLRRQADGSLIKQATLDLTEVAKPLIARNYGGGGTVGISRDGRWVYVYVQDYGHHEGNKRFLAIFRRNTDNGELTFSETIDDAKREIDEGAWTAQMLFLPDGRGYINGCCGQPHSFRIDEKTGRFANIERFDGPLYYAAVPLYLSEDDKFLYCLRWDHVDSDILVLRAAKSAGPTSMSKENP